MFFGDKNQRGTTTPNNQNDIFKPVGFSSSWNKGDRSDATKIYQN